jgi:hypothetical protein
MTNQAAPSDSLGNLVQDGTEMSLFAPRVLVQDAQNLLELGTLSGGLNHVSEPVIKGNESDAIALPEQQMSKRSSDHGRNVVFAQGSRGVVH